MKRYIAVIKPILRY